MNYAIFKFVSHHVFTVMFQGCGVWSFFLAWILAVVSFRDYWNDGSYAASERLLGYSFLSISLVSFIEHDIFTNISENIMKNMRSSLHESYATLDVALIFQVDL